MANCGRVRPRRSPPVIARTVRCRGALPPPSHGLCLKMEVLSCFVKHRVGPPQLLPKGHLVSAVSLGAGARITTWVAAHAAHRERLMRSLGCPGISAGPLLTPLRFVHLRRWSSLLQGMIIALAKAMPIPLKPVLLCSRSRFAASGGELGGLRCVRLRRSQSNYEDSCLAAYHAACR